MLKSMVESQQGEHMSFHPYNLILKTFEGCLEIFGNNDIDRWIFKNNTKTYSIGKAIKKTTTTCVQKNYKTIQNFVQLKAQDILSPDCRRKQTELTINTERI